MADGRIALRRELERHLREAHGYVDEETDPTPEIARTGDPGTFGIIRLSHEVWTLESLQMLHDDDHQSYPKTGTPVVGMSHHHE
jgi:hypothetical protein